MAFVSVYALKCYHLEWHQRQTQCRGLLSESVKRIRRLSATRIIILITGMHSLSDRHKYLARSGRTDLLPSEPGVFLQYRFVRPSRAQLFPGAAFIFHDSKITQMLSRYDSSCVTCNFTNLPFKATITIWKYENVKFEK